MRSGAPSCSRCPTSRHASVPEGRTAEQNVVFSTTVDRGRVAACPAALRDRRGFEHLFDFGRGAKVTGAGFPFYVGDGARLVRALVQFFLNEAGAAGLPGVNRPSSSMPPAPPLWASCPTRKHDVPRRGGSFYLVPTAETPLTNFFRDEILDEAVCRFTAAPTRPASAARPAATARTCAASTASPVRQGRAPQMGASDQELRGARCFARSCRKPAAQARAALPRAAHVRGDLGFAQSKKYDLEVWSAGQKRWLEVSSCSNSRLFSAVARSSFPFEGDG